MIILKKNKYSKEKMKKMGMGLLQRIYLIILCSIVIYPLLIVGTTAFKGGNVLAFDLDLTGNWTLENFTKLFTESFYLDWYKTTLTIALSTMLIQVFAVTLTGYAYSRYNFIGKKQSLKFFLVIQMVPSTAALTAFYVMGLLLGGLDQHWFLTLIYIGGGIPMNAWLMKGYFDTVPKELDESARLDGAGQTRTFVQIVLPLVSPMLAVQALWAFMAPFGEFMIARFLLRTPEKYTVALGLQTFINNPVEQKIGLFGAGSILIVLPICVIFFFLQKSFVSGLTSGGTKG